jgi:hypothetical protein
VKTVIKFFTILSALLSGSLNFCMDNIQVPPPPTVAEAMLNIFNVSREIDKIQALNNSYDQYMDDRFFKFRSGTNNWWLQIIFENLDGDKKEIIKNQLLEYQPSKLKKIKMMFIWIQKLFSQSKIPQERHLEINNTLQFLIDEIEILEQSLNPHTVIDDHDRSILQRCVVITKKLREIDNL